MAGQNYSSENFGDDNGDGYQRSNSVGKAMSEGNDDWNWVEDLKSNKSNPGS